MRGLSPSNSKQVRQLLFPKNGLSIKRQKEIRVLSIFEMMIIKDGDQSVFKCFLLYTMFMLKALCFLGRRYATDF